MPRGRLALQRALRGPDLRRDVLRRIQAIALTSLLGTLSLQTTADEVQGDSTAPQDATARQAELIRPIGSIEFYGLRQLTADRLRDALLFRIGDPIALGSHAFFVESRVRLERIPGIAHAHVDVICCTDERPVVYIGIEEANAPVLRYRPWPTGSVRLPGRVVQAAARFEQHVREAVVSGHAEEDDSEGHMALLDRRTRSAEKALESIAAKDPGLLRQVLRFSADAHHREIAAQILGYVKVLQSAVPDLVYAMTDPASGVRNDAMRALAVFTMATKVAPASVPYEPFVALLSSPVWTDRNKSAFALLTMARHRDPALLGMLRERSLPALVEMARWTDQDHALAPFCILGYVAGLSDDEIFGDWRRNQRERVIAAALASSGS